MKVEGGLDNDDFVSLKTISNTRIDVIVENSDDLTTRFRSGWTTNSFIYFMSYTTINQPFILVNLIRNDLILIPELRWSTAPYSPLVGAVFDGNHINLAITVILSTDKNSKHTWKPIANGNDQR